MDIEPYEEWMEFLEETLDGGTFTTNPALGIAKQVVGQGINSLSEKQKQVFDQQIWPALRPLQIARDRRRNIERILSE